MAPITGSIELITETGESLGLPVVNADPATIPMLAGVLFGVADVAAVEPPRAGVTGEWTATTADHRGATLLLHQAPDFDATLIGRWLATQREGA